MPVRKAEAVWEGDLKSGKGTMEFGSGAYKGAYSYSSRFEEGTGTNPEELIAAAHAGCFSMAFGNILASAGFTPRRIHTTANAHFEKTDAGFRIVKMALDCEAEVPGIDQNTFQEKAQAAKTGCPISNALAAVPEITLNARLVS